jgi:hypothetical protein
VQSLSDGLANAQRDRLARLQALRHTADMAKNTKEQDKFELFAEALLKVGVSQTQIADALRVLMTEAVAQHRALHAAELEAMEKKWRPARNERRTVSS